MSCYTIDSRAKHAVSVTLTALTLATFAAVLILNLTAQKREECKCEGRYCCEDSTEDDPCYSFECYCPRGYEGGDTVCKSRDHVIPSNITDVSVRLIMLGAALAAASMFICCCSFCCCSIDCFEFEEDEDDDIRRPKS